MAFRVNGELFVIASSALQRDQAAQSLDVEGAASAEYRLTELDQIDPAGRYRVQVQDDALHFQRAASPLWATALELMTLSRTGLVLSVPLDLTNLLRLQDLVVDVVEPDVPQVVWLGDGQGPSEEPDGYLALNIDFHGTENPVYVPFWSNKAQ
mgnify:FL=1